MFLGIILGGKKVLLSLVLGNKESYDAWLVFLRDLVERRLSTLLTITTDGAPGWRQVHIGELEHEQIKVLYREVGITATILSAVA